MKREHLFHGTDVELQPGDQVLPRSATGAKANYRMRSSGRDVAYATGSEKSAWQFADKAAGTYGNDNGVHGGRPRVYEVESHPEQRPGLYNTAHPTWNSRVRRHGGYENHDEVVAPAFTVRRPIDIKPGHQGTFPLNWRQFSTHPHNNSNHPYDDEVEHGHPGSTMRKEHTEAFWGASGKPAPREELPGQGRLW